jgi:hypothetical protein
VKGGRLVLQLHRWDVEHDHSRIGDPNSKPYGNSFSPLKDASLVL